MIEAHRLTLELDEETRARWQLAAGGVGMELVEWVLDTCSVASDPESGQIVSGTAEARVEAAERERDYAEEALTAMWQRYVLERTDGSRAANLAELVLRERDKRITARAALACPPQQRGTKLDYGPYDPAGITELLIESAACPPQQRMSDVEAAETERLRLVGALTAIAESRQKLRGRNASAREFARSIIAACPPPEEEK